MLDTKMIRARRVAVQQVPFGVVSHYFGTTKARSTRLDCHLFYGNADSSNSIHEPY